MDLVREVIEKEKVKGDWTGTGTLGISGAYLKFNLRDVLRKEKKEILGFEWRHFGAVYKDCKTDYTGQGVDQLAQVIDKIKNDPNNRRIVLSAWNPADIDKIALPPCHASVVFDVLDGELNCHKPESNSSNNLN
uniref:Thymidylate synthase n=1 Tax=Rhabditophanes sp. KR3021 TaxID=114890 RepID=A0AC35TJ62_9BILA